MSYILEALRKADEERNLGRVPDLQAAPRDAYPRRRRIWPWLMGLLIVLVVNAVVLLMVFQPQFFQRQDVTAQSEPMPLAENTASSPPVIATAQPVESAGNVPPPQPSPVVVLPPPPLESPTVASNTGSPNAEVWQTRPQTDPQELATAAVLPELPTGAPSVPPISLNASDIAAQSLATLPALPAELQRNLPKLNLDVHVYSQAAGKRFVLINANRYQEGEQLNEGPRLEAITADGAVLSYQGQRFLLPVYR